MQMANMCWRSKRFVIFFLSFILSFELLLSSTLLTPVTHASVSVVDTELPKYNVVWNSPSNDITGSMPIGNGNLGALAWAEPNGDLRISLALNDSWDENIRSIRLGDLRVKVSPNPFASGQPFEQKLQYKEGKIVITAGTAPSAITFTLWADANQPVVHLEADSGSNFTMEVISERWRTVDKTLTTTPWSDYIHVANSTASSNLPGKGLVVTESADKVVPGQAGKIIWYHRNETSQWNATASNQGVNPNVIADPFTYRTSGAVVQGTNLQSSSDEKLISTAPSSNYRLDITAQTEIVPQVSTWLTNITNKANTLFGTDIATLRGAHESWWQTFWNKSYMFVAGDAKADIVTKGWIAARYLMAAQGRSEGPIEFNGGLFTFENDKKLWHDYTQFNQRFAYWSMLASGDFDLMQPYFNMNVASIPVAKAKTQAMWGHQGFILSEHMIPYGFQSGSHYGWDRTGKLPSYIYDAWTRLLYTGTPEIADMMLDYYEYTQDAAFVTNKLLPFAKEVVIWYDQHWPKENGKMKMYPIYSGEADRNLTNTTADIASVTKLVNGLLALPSNLTIQADRDYWTTIKSQLPPLPISDGKLRTSEDLALGTDTNNQNLWPIFPLRMYGKGLPDLQVGIDSYLNRRGKAPSGNFGWRHDATHAAYLGMTEEAKFQTVLAFNRIKYRYIGFIDGNPDGLHSIEPLAIGKIALQAMLMQPAGDKINLFNAWPSNWNVKFKLWAPKNTALEGDYQGGVLQSLSVSPSNRWVDVVQLLPANTIATGQTYTLTVKHSGMNVDVQGAGTLDDAKIVQNPASTALNQQWVLSKIDDTYYKIVNNNSGRALVVQYASKADGGKIVQYPYDTGSIQNDEWKIDSVGNGYFKFINRRSGKALELPGANTTEGTQLDQLTYTGGDHQLFKLTLVTP
ncbi:hypothetical protein BC351_24900 [Paenibacillus ferrarius]|uniref:Uncharacterized protein n=1 Tax=Paenibacillus ferrarius TaxID=1469647 RepID=A0A1V4HMS7_9BACL|nr:DUF5703 domain-containing protein [Paenibacillus ferrarius]OPH58178.1 hypothetical protein BC351_24900 [Paenibacillus ferrarius]